MYRPLAVFQTVDQPAVVSGNYTAAGFCFAIAIFAVILAYMQHRESLSLGPQVQSDDSWNGQEGLTTGEQRNEDKKADVTVAGIPIPAAGDTAFIL